MSNWNENQMKDCSTIYNYYAFSREKSGLVLDAQDGLLLDALVNFKQFYLKSKNNQINANSTYN